MDRLRLRLGLTLLVALTACTPPEVRNQQILHVDDEFPIVFQSGFAIAPVVHAEAVPDAANIAAHFSNELHTAFLVSTEDVELVGPEMFINQMALHGDAGFDHFRKFRRARLRGDDLDKDDCTKMSQYLQHRYLLVTWVREEEAEHIENYGQDYTDLQFAEDVRKVSLTMVHGSMQGVLVDLWEARSLWSGIARYQSERVYLQAEGVDEEINRARTAGVIEFVKLFHAP